MTYIELRNKVVKLLHTSLSGPKVILSDQVVPEDDYPYIYYQFISPHMGGASNKIYTKNAEGATLVNRVEQPTASLSFTACSLSDDEALQLSEKAKAFFMHTGSEKFRSENIAVVSVGNTQPRTAPGVVETDRRYGFDVAVRYERTDSRETAAIGSSVIIKEE